MKPLTTYELETLEQKLIKVTPNDARAKKDCITYLGRLDAEGQDMKEYYWKFWKKAGVIPYE